MAVRTVDLVLLAISIVGLLLLVFVVLSITAKSAPARQEDQDEVRVEVVRGADGRMLRRRVRGDGEVEDEAIDVQTGMSRKQLHKEAKKRAREEQRKFEEAQRKARQDQVERKAAARQQYEEERERAEMENHTVDSIDPEAKAAAEEEYNKWKSEIDIEQRGQESDEANVHSQGQLAEDFVNYIQRHRIVVIEDLAAAFQLTASKAIERVRALENMGRLTGVMDDRGKYVYVSAQEMDQVAQLVKRRGRITVSELTHETNKMMQTTDSRR